MRLNLDDPQRWFTVTCALPTVAESTFDGNLKCEVMPTLGNREVRYLLTKYSKAMRGTGIPSISTDCAATVAVPDCAEASAITRTSCTPVNKDSSGLLLVEFCVRVSKSIRATAFTVPGVVA